MSSETYRLFVAIELPDDIRRKLGELEGRLKASGATQARWVAPGSIHLTLVFLGDVASSRVEQIVGAMERAVEGIPPFVLDVKGTGVFPDIARTQVAWVGLSGDTDILRCLQKNVENALEPLGFKPESRAFTPHLTLARVDDRASRDEKRRFGEMVANTTFKGGTIHVNKINLIRSQLQRTGAVYTKLGEVNMKMNEK